MPIFHTVTVFGLETEKRCFLYGDTYVHIFDIHLCLLLQLDNNISVESLELQRGNVTNLLIHTSKLQFSSVTSLVVYSKHGVIFWNI